MIREYNSNLVNTLVKQIKQSGQSFNIKEITTDTYNFKETITHIFISSPKKLTPIILGLKEGIICAIIWLMFIFALLVNYSSNGINSSNKTTSSTSSKKKIVGSATACDNGTVPNLTF